MVSAWLLEDAQDPEYSGYLNKKIETGVGLFFITTPSTQMQPTVSKEKNDYTFTLWRNEEKIIHTFKDAFATVSYGDEKSIPAAQLAKMNSPSYDGWTYHIYVQEHHAERDTEEIFIWISKEEFELLWPVLERIEGPQEEPEDDPYETQEVMRTVMRNYAY